MLVAELTVNDSNLNNILRALIKNEGPDSINPPCRDIIVRDIKLNKPDILVNCYTLEELEGSIHYLSNLKYSVEQAKEIIPNNYNLGLIRDLPINPINMDNLGISKRFRYYFMLKPSKATEKSFCITYNPECYAQRQTPVKLDTGIIKCTTLQVLFEKIRDRQFEPIKRISTEHGEMYYYNMEVNSNEDS